MYNVVLLREARKQYARVDDNIARRINKVIDQIKGNPIFGSHIKRLHGKLRGKYSYVMGGWRIIYEVDVNKKIVEIWYIETRGDVYKKR